MLPTVPPPPREPGCAWHAHQHGTAAEPVARAWLAGELGGAPAALALTRDAHGRPRLGPPFAHFSVSWSHSGAGLLVALGEDVEVGVDLERLRPRPRANALAQRFFTAGEAEWLRRMPGATRELAFVRLWCAKEAVLKAHGRGLAFGLHKLAFAERDDALVLAACDPALGVPVAWSLREFAPQPGYRAALAWRPRDATAATA
ncbi:MAG: 4'-phosphopantetheinyl transferase superfamily protein [Luteimonas sp.]